MYDFFRADPVPGKPDWIQIYQLAYKTLEPKWFKFKRIKRGNLMRHFGVFLRQSSTKGEGPVFFMGEAAERPLRQTPELFREHPSCVR